jgi:hypothetical protein
MTMVTLVNKENGFQTSVIMAPEQNIPLANGGSNFPHTVARKCEKKTIGELHPNLKSQSEEDQVLLEHFNGLCGGTYLEMGALDGVRYSNSFVFNKEFEWKGVLIELTKKSYDRLVINRKNEFATVNAVVCKQAQMIHLVESTGAAVSGIWEFASESFRKTWWPEIKSPDKLPKIQCRPLQDILDGIVSKGTSPTTTSTSRSSSAQIYFDFFSLDVEGAELDVLESIDWNRTAFGIVFLEADGSNQQKENSILSLMKRNGYQFLYNRQRSLWFAHKEYSKIYGHLK